MGIDTEALATILFKILNRDTALKTALGGGIYKGGFRPDDSPVDDIGVNILAITRENPQVGQGNINIYVADKQQNIGGKLQSIKDSPRLQQLTELAIQALENGLKASEFKDVGFFVLDDKTFQNDAKRPEHYKNIRVQFIVPRN